MNDKQYWGGSDEEAKASRQWSRFLDQSGAFEFIHENGKVIIRKVDSAPGEAQGFTTDSDSIELSEV